MMYSLDMPSLIFKRIIDLFCLLKILHGVMIDVKSNFTIKTPEYSYARLRQNIKAMGEERWEIAI